MMQTSALPGHGVNLEEHIVVFFDNGCVLCHWAVQWILRHDRRKRVCFSPLRSPIAKEMLSLTGQLQAETVVVYYRGRTFTQSRAIVQILWWIGGIWRALSLLLYLVPWWVRDAIYRMIARNRYRWFGRNSSCVLLTENERWRFLQ